MRTIIVTGADDAYAPVANDLFLSIAKHQYIAPFELGMLDVGFNAANRKHFETLGVQVRNVRSDIYYPARAHWEGIRPGIRTLTAKPFLRRYFPGYDSYIWLDADVWVQTPEAINAMLAECARGDAVSISCEVDRCHRDFFKGAEVWDMFSGWYEANFDAATAAAMKYRPMLNVGVLAMSAKSPIWDAWAQDYADVLQNTTALTDKSFMAEQQVINILIYLKGLPHRLLPASFNWLTYYTIPMLDRATGLYVETQPPYRPISQIHLTRPNKLQVEKIEYLDGGFIERPLTFYASQTKA